jgi:hypothetical protein
MTRAERRRLERINTKHAKRRQAMDLTPEQQEIHDAFNALDVVVKKLRVTVPTGAKVARAFGGLAEAVDLAMQEIANADKAKTNGAGLRDVTNEVSDETLAAAGVEPKSEPETVQ